MAKQFGFTEAKATKPLQKKSKRPRRHSVTRVNEGYDEPIQRLMFIPISGAVPIYPRGDGAYK